MTVEPTISPAIAHVSALAVLEQNGTEIDDLFREAEPLAEAKTVAAVVTDAVWAATLRNLGHAAKGFLGIDLGNVMITGYCRRARTPTRCAPKFSVSWRSKISPS